jgi:hypothetical protein
VRQRETIWHRATIVCGIRLKAHAAADGDQFGLVDRLGDKIPGEVAKYGREVYESESYERSGGKRESGPAKL